MNIERSIYQRALAKMLNGKRREKMNIEQGIMNVECRRKKLHNSTFLVRHSIFVFYQES